MIKVEVCKEKSMIYHPEYKGIRLDVYAKGRENTHYNIEMQVVKKTCTWQEKPLLSQPDRYGAFALRAMIIANFPRYM